jgi:hypothetical protein
VYKTAAVPGREFVTKGSPFFLNQNTKPVDRTEVSVKKNLRQRRNLCRSVPTVAAVDQYSFALNQDVATINEANKKSMNSHS